MKTTPMAMRVFGAQTLVVPGTPSLVSGGSGGCVKNLFDCARKQIDGCRSDGLGAAARNCDLAPAKHGLSEAIATEWNNYRFAEVQVLIQTADSRNRSRGRWSNNCELARYVCASTSFFA